jgi:UDPglucose 6-dehydrogenase
MADRPRLTVLGAGHLGVTHAACMAAAGFEVLCADVDAERVARLAAGQLPMFEPGLAELLRGSPESVDTLT